MRHQPRLGSLHAKAITQINGYPSTPTPEWDISINGAAQEQAKTTKVIHLGDTIYLHDI